MVVGHHPSLQLPCLDTGLLLPSGVATRLVSCDPRWPIPYVGSYRRNKFLPVFLTSTTANNVRVDGGEFDQARMLHSSLESSIGAKFI